MAPPILTTGMRDSNLKLLLTALATIILVVDPKPSPACPPGEIISREDSSGQECEPCVNGSFNAKYDQYKCEDCFIVDVDHAYLEVIENCTATQDTKVKCRNPDFFYVPHLKKCQHCWQCKDPRPYEAQSCEYYKDTVCCEEPGMIIRDGNCTKPVFCSVKEYLVYRGAPDGRRDECRPCPLNSTNFEAKHWKQSCTELCVDGTTDLALDTVERTECKDDEYTIGRHCEKKDVVICAPCPTASTDLIKVDGEQKYTIASHDNDIAKGKDARKILMSHGGKGQETEGSRAWHFGLAVVVFIVAAVVLILVIYCCLNRENAITPQN